MNTTRIGATAERQYRKILRAAGYQVIRAAASKGKYDLVAINENEIQLIQVKRLKRATPGAITRIRETIRIANPTSTSLVVKKLVVAKQPYGGWTRIVVEEWAIG